MAVVPAGAPSWQRTNDFATYGGDLNKRNYQAQGCTDPTSDVSAEQFSRLVEDVAGIARVGSFATITFLCNDSTPAAPTVLYYSAQAGAQPTLTRNGDGDVTVKWAASYTDAYSVSAGLHIVHTKHSVRFGSQAISNDVVSDSDADGLNDTVRIKVTHPTTGAAIQDATVTLTISTSTA